MSLIITKGSPNLVWGTGSIVSAPVGAIVDSLQLTPKNAEPIEIEDGSGLGANLILLRDGFNAKATVMYDALKTYPIEGANSALTIAFNGASNAAIPYGESTVNGSLFNANGNSVTYTVLVASVSHAFKKKGEMMIDINLVYRPQVAV